jgi:2-desacetyl-2-hydroxyethyl bacteriochlorophyllide A dehydrogenase
MRAAIMAENRTLVSSDVDEGTPGAGQVRLTVTRCGICGSDLHMREMPERFPAGCIIGHEIAGVVAELGRDVAGWRVGDRVAAYHSVSCGECANCRAGDEYMCVDAANRSLGLGKVPGGYAESVVVPVATLFAVPDGVTDEQAALAEPLAIGLHGVNKAAIDPDVPVVVLGAGPIGVMSALGLSFGGHDRIVIVEPNEHRRRLAEQCGFVVVGLDDVDDAVRRALGARPGAVLECSGNVRAAGLAIDLVGYRGRVVLQGRPSGPVPIPQATVLVKEVELVGAVSCTEEEFSRAIEHLAAGDVPAAEIITATVGLAEVDSMFDELLAPGNPHLKVLVAPAA